METHLNKVKFYFDRHIWAKIAKMSKDEIEEIESLLKPLKEQSRIGIYYSPIGMIEMLKGVLSEKHYEVCRREIKLASRLTDTHFLDNPWDHVRRVAYFFTQKPFFEPDLSFLTLCREIVTSPYEQVGPKIVRIRNMLLEWLKEWSDELISISSSFNQLDEEKRGKYKEDEWVKRRKEKLWNSFCRHYSLPQELQNIPLDRAITEFHSFRYWVDYRITYENKLLFENKKARQSDYFDWEQIVYLNIMDYLVTDDRQLIAILSESKNKELSKASMQFTEFIDCLNSRSLPQKRAPESTFEKWYPAR